MAERSLTERVEDLEQKVEALEFLPARMAAVEGQLVQLRDEMQSEFAATRREFGAEMHALREELLACITEGDEETRRDLRREMHSLHEKLVVRIQELDTRITDGDAETRRYMRVLHEEVISRIATIQEGRPRKRR